MSRRIPRLFAALTFVLVATLPAVRAACAQSWTEVGDAGSLPSLAQCPLGTGPLTTLHGTLSDSADVDLYYVHIVTPGTFRASVQCAVYADPNIWLFNASGQGISHQNVCQGGGKTVTGLYVPSPAWYFVAVAKNGVQAQGPGGAIWLSSVYNPVERAPDGPGGVGPLYGWSGAGQGGSVNYQIDFYSTEYCSPPTPALRSTWGALKGAYR